MENYINTSAAWDFLTNFLISLSRDENVNVYEYLSSDGINNHNELLQIIQEIWVDNNDKEKFISTLLNLNIKDENDKKRATELKAIKSLLIAYLLEIGELYPNNPKQIKEVKESLQFFASRINKKDIPEKLDIFNINTGEVNPVNLRKRIKEEEKKLRKNILK